MAAELTGISERTWRDGGPKSKTKQEKLPNLIKESLKKRLENNTRFSKEEVANVLDRLIDGGRGFLSSLIISFGEMQGLSWPITEKLALELDIQNRELTDLLQQKNFPAFKQRILELCNEPPLKLWISSIPQADGLLEKSTHANDMKALDEITSCWAIHAIYKMLACWDLEFQTKYLHPEGSTHNIEIRPLFHLLMPKANPSSKPNSNGEISPRGIFHLPMRQLLEMTICLATFYRDKKFPKKIRRFDVEACAGDPNKMQEESNKTQGKSNKLQGEGNIAKIYRGTMGLTAQEFDDIWVSMCRKNKSEVSPMAPWPIYIATQIWTHLYVTKTSYKGFRIANAIVTPGTGIYEYWWYHHHKQIELKTQNSKVAVWPKCILSKEASEAEILNLS